jgi:preprotein translocase subunit SecG
MKAGLFVFGLIILIGMFIFSNVIITPQQKQEVQLANSVCNLNVGLFGFNIPIGQAAQALSPEVAQQCNSVSTIAKILSYETYVYIIGFIILILGLALGGNKEVIREVVREKSEKSEEEPEEEEEEKEEHKSKKGKSKVKYCSECGSENKIGDKFCENCGKKLK